MGASVTLSRLMPLVHFIIENRHKFSKLRSNAFRTRSGTKIRRSRGTRERDNRTRGEIYVKISHKNIFMNYYGYQMILIALHKPVV